MLGVKDLKLIANRLDAVDVLMGNEKFADKVLKGGNVVNVITREIYEADIAIRGNYILMVGDCSDLIGEETTVVDMKGKFLTPGFIDAHMHFESAMLTATEFSRLSLPTGTTCLVTDPHEIGNVLGRVGVKALSEECATLPHHVYNRVPALTPDSPGLETAGEEITSTDLPEMFGYPTVTGIGEIQGVTAMQFVYDNNYEVVRDTIAATTYARGLNKGVDGNATELFGKDLAGHIICGGTDISCHETTTKAEAMEKLRYGVYMLMREGSTQRNMPECIRAVTEEGMDSRRAILATDDMLAGDIMTKGHMNDIVRRTIKEGVDPVEAIQMVTINPATWLGLSEIGVLAPGKYADIAVIEGALEDMNVVDVYLKGEHIASNRELLIKLEPYTYPDDVKNSVRRGKITKEDLILKSDKDKVIVNCVELIVDQNLTGGEEIELPVVDGYVQSDKKEIIPIVVVGRHGQVDIGSSYVKGFNIENGAFAESVLHDTHNIVAVGTNYEDIVVAVNQVIEQQGGLAVAKDGKVLDNLVLNIAGLMTDELTAPEYTVKMESLIEVVEKELGCDTPAPFMHLSFLGLSTSPKWKITDKGVVDAAQYKVIPSIKE